LINCPDTLSGVASAMLSLPTLAQPLNIANESPATQQTRHAMAAPDVRCVAQVNPDAGRISAIDDVGMIRRDDYGQLLPKVLKT